MPSVSSLHQSLDCAGNPGWSPILWCGMCRNPGADGTGDANQRRFPLKIGLPMA
jgi:hypothetical protein